MKRNSSLQYTGKCVQEMCVQEEEDIGEQINTQYSKNLSYS